MTRLFATKLGPDSDVLVIAECGDWVNCEEKIACREGWVYLDEML